MVVTGVAIFTTGVVSVAGSGLAPAHADDAASSSIASITAGGLRGPAAPAPPDGPTDPDRSPAPADPTRPPTPPAVVEPAGQNPKAAPKRPATAPVSDPSDPPSDTDPDTAPALPKTTEPVEPKSTEPVEPKSTEPVEPKAGEPAAAEPVTPKAPAAAPRAPAAPTEAAKRYGWGAPGAGTDEFNYTGAPDPAKWSQAGECWAGHDGNGGRCASKSRVDGSKLVQTGTADGDSGWIASRTNQKYGRWEARVRSEATGRDNGRQYHPLLIIWPQSDRWPQDGEYDFLENGAPGELCAESYIHYPHNPGPTQQVFTKEKNCGAPLTEWHNVAFEWTPDHVRGYIDGKQWFSYSGGAQGGRRAIQDMPSGHLTIQLDNFFGGNMQPATYEVDWVRTYALR